MCDLLRNPPHYGLPVVMLQAFEQRPDGGNIKHCLVNETECHLNAILSRPPQQTTIIRQEDINPTNSGTMTNIS